MRDLKGADFDVKDLENELKSVIKEIDKVKKKNQKRDELRLGKCPKNLFLLILIF